MATLSAAETYPVNSNIWAASNYVAKPLTPYSGTFIPTLWSGKLMKKFYEESLFGAIANTDWEGEIRNYGDTVVINTVPDVVVRDYSAGAQLQYDVPEGETFTLTIDHGKYFAINIEDVMKKQSQIPFQDLVAKEAAYQMKMAIDYDVIYGVFFDKTTGTFKTNAKGAGALAPENYGAGAGAVSSAYDLGTDTDPVALTSSNILSYITMLSSVLDEANVPEDGRYLVISPYDRYLLMNSNLAAANLMGDAQSTLRNGRIGRIDRFDIYVSHSIPVGAANKGWGKSSSVTIAGAAPRHLIWAGTKAGITFASQITKVERLRNPTSFGDLMRGLNVYGFTVSQGQALACLVAADADASGAESS